MPRILLYAHGGSKNRGCEAIVRGTWAIIRKRNGLKAYDIHLLSNNSKSDRDVGLEELMALSDRTRIPWRSIKWGIVKGFNKVLKVNEFPYRLVTPRDLKAARESDIGLSIGGDNYCYLRPTYLYAMNSAVARGGGKSVLWGCSIEPDTIKKDASMRKDLSRLSLITPRESITYQALLEADVNKNVHLHADPAFVMQPEKVPLPDDWLEGGMVGINLSPLLLKYQKKNGRAEQAVIVLIKHILETTEFGVALIPHVTISGNNDWETLSGIKDVYGNNPRVILVGQNYNSPQMKHIISQCRLFIGSRTHSTIAAYSSCVPALALGYSVKAKGIARDIFGSEQGLVLPVQELDDENKLVDAFMRLMERAKELRTRLHEVMPGYIQSAMDAGRHLEHLS
jgi:colanic acid/amylovoran biosynthesis protein